MADTPGPHPEDQLTEQPVVRMPMPLRPQAAKRRSKGEVIRTAAQDLADRLAAGYPPNTVVTTRAELAKRFGFPIGDATVIARTFVAHGLLAPRGGYGGGFVATANRQDPAQLAAAVKAVAVGAEDITPVLTFPRQYQSASPEEAADQLRVLADSYAGLVRLPSLVQTRSFLGVSTEALNDTLRCLTDEGLLVSANHNRGMYLTKAWTRPRHTYAEGPLSDGPHRVAFDIRSRIERQILLRSEPLPGQDFLSNYYNYGGSTVALALKMLRDEGLVTGENLIGSKLPRRNSPFGISPLARQIRESIQAGELGPGARVRVAAIQREHGVRRVDADAAVRQLVSAHSLAPVRDGRGWQVVTQGSNRLRSEIRAPSPYDYKRDTADVAQLIIAELHRPTVPQGLGKAQRVADAVGRLVADGRLSVGSQIPPIHDLAALLPDIGKHTVDAARKALIAAGALSVEDMSAGTVVAPGPYLLHDIVVNDAEVARWAQSVQWYPLLRAGKGKREWISSDIHRRIESGELPAGHRLPGAASLTAIYRTSSRPDIVPAVLEGLTREKLVEPVNDSVQVDEAVVPIRHAVGPRPSGQGSNRTFEARMTATGYSQRPKAVGVAKSFRR